MSTPYGTCEDGDYQPRPAAPATAWPDPGGHEALPPHACSAATVSRPGEAACVTARRRTGPDLPAQLGLRVPHPFRVITCRGQRRSLAQRAIKSAAQHSSRLTKPSPTGPLVSAGA